MWFNGQATRLPESMETERKSRSRTCVRHFVSGFDMIILHPLQPEVDYLSIALQGLRFGQSFFVGSHVPLRETMEKEALIARKFGRLAIG